ncbi:MAG: aminodeoxychorismate synthase component I, partial [Candidatus Omnitrophica bacterium]|nr:aminodeoxychorismate synthase component I [Candidatus Omnitrophota bacterium]
AVEEAKKYIISGDIYQVNLSQRFKTDLESDAFYLYRILRTINPASFASFLNFAPVQILSASPERFLKKKDCTIETRPIKGTRPRGNNPKEDTRLRRELAKSKKDNAENLMIIDLERNDLGRISEYGSVYVTEFMTCEEYATVFHLVSEVRGRLKNKIDAMDCLINCFPGGSITGAPKIRSMEIIEELEPVKRAVYTGSIGYISFNGNMDTSIVIRTLLVKEKSLYFHVGGGIVYDSDPEKEYEETLHKAKALIEAIEFAAPCLQTFRRRKTTLL